MSLENGNNQNGMEEAARISDSERRNVEAARFGDDNDEDDNNEDVGDNDEGGDEEGGNVEDGNEEGGDSDEERVSSETLGNTEDESLTSTVTNNDVYQAFLKHKRKRLETARYLLTLPETPRGNTPSSLSSAIASLLKKYNHLSKRGRAHGGPEAQKSLLALPFQFPPGNPKKRQNTATSLHLDSEESLLLAHSTVDAELTEWAKTVQRGFQSQGITEAEECEKLEKILKRKRSDLTKMKSEVVKAKFKYGAVMEEAKKEEELANLRMEEYKSREDPSSVKGEAKRMKMQEETREILQKVDEVREEKLTFLLKNDGVERHNQDLRGSVYELSDRCLECRVDEHPNSKLKPKISQMVGELLRLGIPRQSVNIIVKEMLGLTDFRVIGLPTPEEIEKIEKQTCEEPD